MHKKLTIFEVMNDAQEVLWNKIKDFELDDPSSSLTFTDRLARENGWTIEFAVRATHEYKKFIFMLCVSNESLTPSDQVDQVWHLHLIYTYSYWTEFCQNLLGKSIHHGPTKGGESEGNKYKELYENTLDMYTNFFNRKAPDDIWPSSEIRFKDINFQRLNLNKNWIVKKPYFLTK